MKMISLYNQKCLRQNLEQLLNQLDSDTKKLKRKLDKKHKIIKNKVPWSLTKLVLYIYIYIYNSK